MKQNPFPMKFFLGELHVATIRFFPTLPIPYRVVELINPTESIAFEEFQRAFQRAYDGFKQPENTRFRIAFGEREVQGKTEHNAQNYESILYLVSQEIIKYRPMGFLDE